MTRLTDEEVLTLAKLESEATKGVWTNEAFDGTGRQVFLVAVKGDAPRYPIARYVSELADAAFIAAARNALPRLLAEREEMRRELEEVIGLVGAARIVEAWHKRVHPNCDWRSEQYGECSFAHPSIRYLFAFDEWDNERRRALEGKAG